MAPSTRPSVLAATFMGLLLAAPGQAQEVDLGPPFGRVELVEEIDCGQAPPADGFFEEPVGASQVQTVLGRAARVLPNEGGPAYFSYRIGAGRGLSAGGAYVLVVDYPQDAPRTLFIINRGAETTRGLTTGRGIGDTVGGYTNNNLESVDAPLSGAWERWSALFYLHDHLAQDHTASPMTRPLTPADGFWVAIARAEAADAPESAGPAVARIALYRVPDDQALFAPIPWPPAPLPRRHLFWREEMSDGVLNARDGNQPGVEPESKWFDYKARQMRFLGMDTYALDLLEFGANQGWDSSEYGGNDWVYQSDNPQRWEQVLALAKQHGLSALPYYEYCGSKGAHGLGFERRCRPLGDATYNPDTGHYDYTHVWWTEVANADVTDPDTFEDLRKILELTVVRPAADHDILGAWIRTRPSQLPISFADAALARFAAVQPDLDAVTRAQLQADAQLYERYLAWWYDQRKAFLLAIRDYLRTATGKPLLLMFTPYSGEPGPSIGGGQVATDDEAFWQALGLSTRPFQQVLDQDAYTQAVLSPPGTWGDWEWQHAVPPADPDNFRQEDGVLLSLPFNRQYTVRTPAPFDAMRLPAGLAMVRHYPLNENRLHAGLGYQVSDVERAGPACMWAEAQAMANGDPHLIGYLSAARFTRGFPQAVRAFNLAFLALPALPSQPVPGASSDPAVVVRQIPTPEHGTYLAVVNTSLEAKAGVQIQLPVQAAARDLVGDEAIGIEAGAIRLDFGPAELKAIRLFGDIDPEPDPDGGQEDGGLGDGESADGDGDEPDGGIPADGDAGTDTDPAKVKGSACGCTQGGGSGGCLLLGLLAWIFVRPRRVRTGAARP